jgi:hypothetical protein
LYSFANKTLFLPDFRPQLQRWIIKSTIFQMTRHICHSNLNKDFDSNRFYNLWRDKLRKNLMHTFFSWAWQKPIIFFWQSWQRPQASWNVNKVEKWCQQHENHEELVDKTNKDLIYDDGFPAWHLIWISLFAL